MMEDAMATTVAMLLADLNGDKEAMLAIHDRLSETQKMDVMVCLFQLLGQLDETWLNKVERGEG